jgi:hypothetical protein
MAHLRAGNGGARPGRERRESIQISEDKFVREGVRALEHGRCRMPRLREDAEKAIGDFAPQMAPLTKGAFPLPPGPCPGTRPAHERAVARRDEDGARSPAL